MKALISSALGNVALVGDRPKPSLREDYLLIKTHAIALNPTDWKHAELTATPGILLGCDYAGVVEEVGSAVAKKFKKGDRVMGFVHGGNSLQPEDGAFAEYIVAKGDIQAHIPNDMRFEDAASFGVGITSVGQALYQTLKLPMPSEKRDASEGKILIYGGSTASGILGLQCAKLSGFSPIATCSQHNFDLVTEFGAEETFDYGDGDAAEEIRDATGNDLGLCWDTISTAWTGKFCADSLSSKGGRLATLHPMRSPSPNVECVDTKAYTIFGEDWGMGAKMFPAQPKDFEFGKVWWSLAEALIAKGDIKPHKIQVGENGLLGAIEGLKLLRDSRVSGHKLVYRVAETP
jgi:NADPH:quinone reductase-like Zn-dependent oxidoreductase